MWAPKAYQHEDLELKLHCAWSSFERTPSFKKATHSLERLTNWIECLKCQKQSQHSKAHVRPFDSVLQPKPNQHSNSLNTWPKKPVTKATGMSMWEPQTKTAHAPIKPTGQRPLPIVMEQV